MDEATQSQHRIIQALQYLYTEDPPVSDEIIQRVNLPSQKDEITGGSVDDIIPMTLSMKQEHGQYNALQFLYYNFQRMIDMGGRLDKWSLLFMVEHGEVGELFLDRHPDGAVLRGCAFFEHFFYEVIEWQSYLRPDENEQDLSFARLINMATYDEEQIIPHVERKLLHYVRHVRNDIAHHSWLDKDYTYDAVFMAARVLIYLLGEFVEREVRGSGVDIPEAPNDIDPQSEYLDTIEEEYGWEYNEERHYWNTSDLDETPPL